MTRSQSWLDGRRLLWLGSAIFVFLGIGLELGSSFALIDFKAVYYGARCVMQHRDPYQEREFLSVYRAEGGTFPSDATAARSVSQAVPICINLPSALFLVAPLALAPWRVAAAIWMMMTATSLIIASFLIWNVASAHAPRVSAGLAFLLLANSELTLVVGNSSGIVISLCVIAAWCLLREKFVYAGVVCLAVALLIKPQDAGLVWLYFLLAGGMLRRRALQTAFVAAGLAGLAVLWVTHVSPHWLQEMQINIAATTARGGLNDPGLTSLGGHGLGMVISLQALLSFFHDDPHFYNPVTWIVCAVLIAIWMVRTLRADHSPQSAWFGLATASVLSMLPSYHRAYDARLLLLAIPACAMLWAQGRRVRWLAVMVTGLAIVCTGDLFSAATLLLIKSAFFAAGLPGMFVTAIQVFPAPLTLLAACVFYLWIHPRRYNAALSVSKYTEAIG